MGSFYSGDIVAEDDIHTDITTCNTEELQQKYRLGSLCNKLLVGGLNIFYWIQTLLDFKF